MYEAKNYEHLLGLAGFSDDLLTNHFGLYQGYVKNTNLLIEKLEKKEPGTPGHSELTRRVGWEWNGMRMHELYFANMTKESVSLAADVALMGKIEGAFGSYEKWQEDFMNVGKLRGVGWVVLAHDKEADRLFNVWIAEHDGGHLAGCVPLVVMDVWEHAFVLDYGVDRASYISAFMNAIDWSIVESRIGS